MHKAGQPSAGSWRIQPLEGVALLRFLALCRPPYLPVLPALLPCRRGPAPPTRPAGTGGWALPAVAAGPPAVGGFQAVVLAMQADVPLFPCRWACWWRQALRITALFGRAHPSICLAAAGRHHDGSCQAIQVRGRVRMVGGGWVGDMGLQVPQRCGRAGSLCTGIGLLHACDCSCGSSALSELCFGVL